MSLGGWVCLWSRNQDRAIQAGLKRGVFLTAKPWISSHLKQRPFISIWYRAKFPRRCKSYLTR